MVPSPIILSFAGYRVGFSIKIERRRRVDAWMLADTVSDIFTNCKDFAAARQQTNTFGLFYACRIS